MARNTRTLFHMVLEISVIYAKPFQSKLENNKTNKLCLLIFQLRARPLMQC